MGQDILWHDVKWDKLVAYGDPELRLEAVDLALEEEAGWLREFGIPEEWQGLQENFGSFLEFNDAMERSAPEVLHRLHAEFPVLRDIGVLWDPSKSCPLIPKDLPMDESGHMMGSLAPERVAEVLESLKGMDRELLAALVQKAVEAETTGGIFESASEFLEFIDAVKKGFEKTVKSGRGILVLLSY